MNPRYYLKFVKMLIVFFWFFFGVIPFLNNLFFFITNVETFRNPVLLMGFFLSISALLVIIGVYNSLFLLPQLKKTLIVAFIVMVAITIEPYTSAFSDAALKTTVIFLFWRLIELGTKYNTILGDYDYDDYEFEFKRLEAIFFAQLQATFLTTSVIVVVSWLLLIMVANTFINLGSAANISMSLLLITVASVFIHKMLTLPRGDRSKS